VVAAQEIVRATLHFVEDVEILDYEPVAFQWRQRREVFQTMLVQFDILPDNDAHEAQRPKAGDQLLRKDIKSAPPCPGLDAPWRLRIYVHDPAAIITLANPQVQDDASDDSRSRIAACRIQMGLCHHGDFLHEHMVMPISIDQGALHPSWERLINVSENVDSHG
jgi:hypothetical protein